MERVLQLMLEDFGDRQKTMIPVWNLGSGGDFGRLNPVSKQISFSLISVMFYQELLNDVRRTREDLILYVQKIAALMNMECSYDESEKIIDALLVSTDSQKFLFTFQDKYYNEKTKQWEVYQYQYLEIDRYASNLEDGIVVYKLTEVARNMFLNTNEIQQYLSVPIQQLLIDLLIEKGDLKTALRLLDGLNHRAGHLLREEKIHRDELIRNPKDTIYKNRNRWNKQLSEVEQQFQDEAENYKKTEGILKKIEVSPKHQDTYLKLFNRVTKTIKLHDELARTVIGNVRLELEIRNTHFRGMWLTNITSFRKNIWEQHAKVVGFSHPNEMLAIVESIMSPKKPSILPLEWGMEDQTETALNTFVGPTTKKPTNLEPIKMDWEAILLLWKKLFDELLNKGKLTLGFLKELDEVTLARWVENREAFDFWLAFASAEEAFIIDELNLSNDNDDRAILITKLMATYPEMSILWNKKVGSVPAKDTVKFKNKVDASNFILTLEEV
uniref:Uncharacterized protein n=1 Tax=Anaerobacillus isosaccharinicus TaxID=1532552 RepID=A0A1S2MDH2_9BACI